MTYGTPADKIVAYNFSAEILCPTCTIESMIGIGIASPAARDMREEDALNQIAGANGIDRMDEWSFDTDEFPKVVFSCQVEYETCDHCEEELR